MSIKEKIDDIKKRLNLNSKQFCKLLEIPFRRLDEIEKGNITDIEKEKFKKIINVEYKDLINEEKVINNLGVRKEINLKQYKNFFHACSEILKEYYSKPCKIYVLTKVRKKNFIVEFFELFFRNSKKAVINQMSDFEPSFLIKNNGNFLLVHITKKFFKVDEVELNEADKIFVFKGFRYRVANELTLK